MQRGILFKNGGMTEQLFFEVGAVLVLAGVFSLAAHILRQPLIIAYLLTGVVVGPSVLGIVQSPEVFGGFSQIGIALLLFIVGLNLNWRSVREVGGVAFTAGVAQVAFTSVIGFGIARAFHIDVVTAIFLAVAFSFSSTIIIIKLLSDKEDLERLYGRISVGILIVQDLIAMFTLLVLAALNEGGTLSQIVTVSLVKGVAVLAGLFVVSRTVLPVLFRFAARSQELLFLTALGWCFALASGLLFLGFGIEIGALMAGISLASSGFQHEIEAKVRTLRDFFLVIFFIVLGMQLTVGSLGTLWLPALVLSAFVLIGKPLIVMTIMRAMGYHPRPSFMAGTTVAQISEFSFIFLAAGVAAGFIQGDAITLATIVALVTIMLSSYLIAYNEQLYERFAGVLEFFGQGRVAEGRRAAPPSYILFGYNRMGKRLLPQLQQLSGDALVVDYNPVAIDLLAKSGVPSMYGDASNEDVLYFLHAERAKMIISTIPDIHVNIDLLEYLRQRHAKCSVVVTARSSEEAARCYELGATYVVIPSVLGGEALGQFLKKKKVGKMAWKSLAKKQSHSEIVV